MHKTKIYTLVSILTILLVGFLFFKPGIVRKNQSNRSTVDDLHQVLSTLNIKNSDTSSQTVDCYSMPEKYRCESLLVSKKFNTEVDLEKEVESIKSKSKAAFNITWDNDVIRPTSKLFIYNGAKYEIRIVKEVNKTLSLTILTY